MPRPVRVPSPVYVLAPSYIQFRRWCREHGYRTADAVYLYKPERAQGLPRRARVAAVPGWSDGRHARAIWRELLAADAVGYGPFGVDVRRLPSPWHGQEQVPSPEPRTASQTVQELLELYHSTGVERHDLPALRDGEAHVYLANGQRAGQVVVIRQGDTVWNTVYFDTLRIGSGANNASTVRVLSYTIRLESVCQLLTAGNPGHPLTPACGTHIRVGYVGGGGGFTWRQADVERALDTLMPSWRALPNRDSGHLDRAAPPRDPYGSLPAQMSNYYMYGALPSSRSPGYTTPPVAPYSYSSTSQLLEGLAGLTGRSTAPPQDTPATDTPDENGWYRPMTTRELNWADYGETADGVSVCAHVCGGDHQCDARATTQITFELPTGGMREMPVCQACYEAETASPAA